MSLESEIKKRRTFAIISHPDAGKTTLTEKFLLYGGAINLAGSVKGKKTAKHAVSDWMEIEKERGISVTSSVLKFKYVGYFINILYTPGHQDFSEDTYRTLMAADSAVMVIDASKGVEKQTIKLFKVCVMRHIPIFTFINKMDREANDPFELLDEIESVLGIATCPINWPIGCGKEFKGVYDRKEKNVSLFKAAMNGQKEVDTEIVDASDEAVLKDRIGDAFYDKLQEDIELLDGASAEFDQEMISAGDLTPVFFGSALTNFGVQTFLEHFLSMTTSPLPRKSDQGVIDPFTEDFSAFVFKIQANMNKAHRDRIAFMRICSGKFQKGLEVFHMQGGKKVKLAQPQQFMAQDREIVEDSMKKVGVYELKDKLITELSGGQLQRVFLAKIFAQDPDIILLDEPTNHLDFKHQIELLENLSEWVKKNNKIVIGVLHDLNLVQYFADNVLMIKSGEGVSYGKPEDVFKRDVLNDIYGIDIKEFMLNILEKWA